MVLTKMVITGAVQSWTKVALPNCAKYSCWKTIDTVLCFPVSGKLSLLGENKTDAIPFHHIMMWEHFSSVVVFSVPQRRRSTFLGSLVTEKPACSTLIWDLPFPYTLGQIFEVTLNTPFLSSSFIFDIHFNIRNLFATVFTEATASIQGVYSSEVAGSTLYF